MGFYIGFRKNFGLFELLVVVRIEKILAFVEVGKRRIIMSFILVYVFVVVVGVILV